MPSITTPPKPQNSGELWEPMAPYCLTDAERCAYWRRLAREQHAILKTLRRKVNDYISIGDIDALDAVIAKAEGR